MLSQIFITNRSFKLQQARKISSRPIRR